MLLHITLDNALKTIQGAKLVKKDIVIPGQFPAVSNSPYRPGYDWLFVYERKLARFLEPWLKQFRLELIGEKGILSEALSNAYYHGHAKSTVQPIKVRVYVGVRGLIIRIKDSGNGFSIRNIYEKFENGKAYFHTAGNGLRLMIFSKRFGVFYNKTGNAFHLLYLFDEDLSVLSKSMVHGDFQGQLTHAVSVGAGGTAAVSDKIKSKMHFVDPPNEDTWVAAAILLDIIKNKMVGFNIGREQINILIRSCGLLVRAIDKMDSHLQIGSAITISVRSPGGTLMLSRNLSKEHILITVLKENANPVLAGIQLPEIFEYLYEKI